jgi:hypothetical protein
MNRIYQTAAVKITRIVIDAWSGIAEHRSRPIWQKRDNVRPALRQLADAGFACRNEQQSNLMPVP